jgi:hypothetical protein
MLPNRTGFQAWMRSNFKKDKYKPDGLNKSLFMHQRFVKDFLQHSSPYRGLLLFMGLGTGKSCASIAASEVLQSHDMDIVVLLPASLAENFRNELMNCGNKMYRLKQSWIFHPQESIVNLDEVLTKLRLSKKTFKKNKGVWLPRSLFPIGSGISYDSLSNDQFQSLKLQLHDMISNRYTVIHYNGLNTRMIQELSKNGNPFDNKIVIIDEVHNFISRTLKGYIGPSLYDLLINASSAKLIMLSGTPIINYPYEIGRLLSLAHGKVKEWQIKYTSRSNFNESEVQEYLAKHKYVDAYDLNADGMLKIVLTPENFAFSNKEQYLVKRANDPVTHIDMIDVLENDLKRLGMVVSKRKDGILVKSEYILPKKEDDFNNTFVDFSNTSVTNPYLFKRRIQGVLSYYNVYSPSLYPKLLPLHFVKVPLSPEQMATYVKVREEEQIKEERANRRRRQERKSPAPQNIFRSATGVYRTFSRIVSLFTFPAGIKRPFKMDKLSIKRSMETFEDEDETEFMLSDSESNSDSNNNSNSEGNSSAKNRSTTWQQQLVAKLLPEHLSMNGSNGLKRYGPKMYEAISRVMDSPGTCLMYSQFRSLEGLAVLATALRANGFAEIRLKLNQSVWTVDMKKEDFNKPKFFVFDTSSDTTKEATKYLMNIFNSEFDALPQSIQKKIPELHAATNGNHQKNLYGSIVKVMLITASGAEGISLKNVRQVHIMEPYWNMVRINQVIGRAIRAKSHIALPEKDRTVEVFVYVSTFTPSQKKVWKIRTIDDGMTSDETIIEIAQRKSKIVDQLLQLTKEGAARLRVA